MNNFFNPDNRLMRALSRLFDLMILNIITVALCIPVITAGAALTAMHAVLIQIVEDREGYIIRGYFVKFRENFKKATLIWLIVLVVSVLLALDFRIVNAIEGSMGSVMTTALTVVAVIYVMIVQYVFPLTARYENTLRGTFDTAVRVSIAFFPRTAAMVIISIAVAVVGYRYMQYALPLLFLLGISGTSYLCAQLYVPIFHKLEPAKPDEEADRGSELPDIDDTPDYDSPLYAGEPTFADGNAEFADAADLSAPASPAEPPASAAENSAAENGDE